jgi:multidrug resistance protein
MIFGQNDLPPEVINHPLSGSGRKEDPYLVDWLPGDEANPMNFRDTRKWLLNLLGAFSAFTVALASSAYSGGLAKIIKHFAISEEVALLGVSLFVVGFAIGPLVWAPLSERYGRRYVFVASGAALTATLAGTAGAQNIETLLVLRFLAGSLGSAPMAITGGLIADLFSPASRGLALGLFVVAPFSGPALGPIIGGFMAERGGWQWVEGLLAIIACAQLLVILFFLPETYPPVLLRRRARRLSKLTGNVYRSIMEVNHASSNLMVTLSRPWVLLFREPIVLLISVYMSIIYGTLYMFFAAYPIIFQKIRGWDEGLGGLSFLGILVGILSSIPSMFIGHARYQKKALNGPKRLAPETRLPDCFIASIALPIGLFWFAWTNSPSIHWIVPILAGIPFGYGCIMVFLPCLNYLVDSYTIYAASVLAANSALRSMFGAAFPLFTGKMYDNLGIHWAASVPAFMALVCVPIPYLFYVYGARIRQRCHYAAEADAFMNRILGLSPETAA